MTRVLLVEDTRDLAFAVTQALESEGFDVTVVGTGEEGVAAMLAGGFQLLILDLMLPGIDGFRVLRRIRDAGLDTPILVLTARGEEDDKVRGFRLGADDYLTKPFGVRELVARADALVRRAAGRRFGSAPAASDAPVVRFGNVEVYPEGRVVRKNGVVVSLRPKIMDLLLALIAREGRVVSREHLLRDIWGYNTDVTTRTIDIHMVELRKTIEDDPTQPVHIVTIRKSGYRFDLTPHS